MKIEFEVDEKTLNLMAHDAIRSKLGPGKSSAVMLGMVIDVQVREVIEALDFRSLIKAEIDAVVKEIVTAAVHNQLRGIAKTIVQQEIEKVRAAATEPAKVRE